LLVSFVNITVFCVFRDRKTDEKETHVKDMSKTDQQGIFGKLAAALVSECFSLSCMGGYLWAPVLVGVCVDFTVAQWRVGASICACLCLRLSKVVPLWGVHAFGRSACGA